ncbi:Uncharacterized protein Adt_46929 [Abeliophyllum distichum]|uniref:U3 small nucleolar RNA-associated protein 11 n=1 Tax=Abeliophyllum distichum TaxID=126358 RepID=A0ABD1NWY2_9LAMI
MLSQEKLTRSALSQTQEKKFGILEKHKDYVQRARAYHQKEQTIQKLKEKAAFRNPDEFYFKMIKTKIVDGVHKPEILDISRRKLKLTKREEARQIKLKKKGRKRKLREDEIVNPTSKLVYKWR